MNLGKYIENFWSGLFELILYNGMMAILIMIPVAALAYYSHQKHDTRNSDESISMDEVEKLPTNDVK